MTKRSKNTPCIFLDSNMLFSNPEEVDNRVQELYLGYNEYWITDIVKREIRDLESRGKEKIFHERLNITSFSELRKQLPSVCAVYYNLISRMYNPANITSPEFLIHLLQSLKLRGHVLNRKQEHNYMLLMDRLKNDLQKSHDIFGHKKNELQKNMDISMIQYFKKKFKNRNSKNLLNDYKNISIIILFIILKQRSVTFVTSDRDLIAIVLILCESIVQDMAFSYSISTNLSNNDKKALFQSQKITKFLDFQQFAEQNKVLLAQLLNPNWQKEYKYLKIKLWDNQKKHFVEDLVIKFTPLTQDAIINMHGPLACPYGKNNTHGNWIHYQFWPPAPESEKKVVQMVLSAKEIINRDNIHVSDFMHKETCRYAIDDEGGKLNGYYGFSF